LGELVKREGYLGAMSVTVVADIGGTSSRWGVLLPGAAPRIIDGLPGFNPAVGDPRVFIAALRDRFHSEAISATEVFAYGAGCGTLQRATRMAEVLLSVWPQARVDVASDLMGAAHGLLGDQPGLVLILGTGMNAGWYTGAALHQPMPSLGYILGDEGSGADIGKQAVTDALHGRMPQEIRTHLFPDDFGMPLVVEQLYRGSAPQAWLASFVEPLGGMMDHPYVLDLIASRSKLLVRQLRNYFPAEQCMQIHATGSVAFGFQTVLANVLEEAGMHLSEVQRSPLPGLLNYRSRPAL
jgi:glucosamine kinase